MATELKLGDISVDVVLKDIKNIHLSVHPPTGRVRIAAPAHMKMETIRVYAVSRIGWIRSFLMSVCRATKVALRFWLRNRCCRSRNASIPA